jgi:hypothetical protein
MINKKMFIILILLFNINNVSGVTGLVTYNSIAYFTGQYGVVAVYLDGGDFTNYSYYIEQRNPYNSITETGRIYSDGSYQNQVADNSFNVIGNWTINIISCGFNNCVINRNVLDSDITEVTYNSSTQFLLKYSVLGNGQVYVFRNSDLIGLATSNNSISVGYNIGDNIGYRAYPYLDNYLNTVCDTPFTECNSDVFFNGVVIGQLPEKLTFSFLPRLNNMPLKFEIVGNGQVYIFKNNDLYGLATNGYNVTIYYSVADMIGYQTYPDINESLISVCDVPFTECNNNTYFNGTVTDQLPNKLVFTFSKNTIHWLPIDNTGFNSSSGLAGFLNTGGYASNIEGLYNFANDYMIYYTLFGITCFIILFSRRN